ncbi:MAG: pseudouridine synthase [Candidatus Zixiibacteriota bacterium]
MRLNRFLSLAGVTSRRKADLLIKAGRVEVNGKRIKSLGASIDENQDQVKIDGARVKLKKNFIYLLLNKPKGFLTTTRDDFKRSLVLDLISGIKERIFPVGRLDCNTQGVLLLTNDGDLTYRLTHPRFQVPKVYKVEVKGKVLENRIKGLKRGIRLENGSLAKGEAKILNRTNEKTTLKLKLNEGKKREVKRIFKALGYKVENLERLSFAGITAEGLKSGEWRNLFPKEVLTLKKMTSFKEGKDIR